MTDRSQQIATLRALRATITDASYAAALDATIAQLEAAEGVPPAPPTIEQRTIATSGGDYAEGDIDKRQGTFYAAQVQTFFLAAGTPDPSVEQRTLLVSYLDGLVARCERLRITGMVERERTQGKALRVTLSQVYVALAATTWQTVEEADTPDALRDALAAGDAATVLPWDARRLVESAMANDRRCAPNPGDRARGRSSAASGFAGGASAGARCDGCSPGGAGRFFRWRMRFRMPVSCRAASAGRFRGRWGIWS